MSNVRFKIFSWNGICSLRRNFSTIFYSRKEKIAHAFNLFDYNLRISIHLQVGSYCLFYRLQIRGTQEI